MIRGNIFVPSQKVRPLGLYFVYYPEGIFFCDRTNLTPSDKKLSRGANRGGAPSDKKLGLALIKAVIPSDKKFGRAALKVLLILLVTTDNYY